MEPKYSNIFFVSVNPISNDAVISFKHEIPVQSLTPNGTEVTSCMHDVATIVLTLQNAISLRNVIDECLAQMLPTEESSNG